MASFGSARFTAGARVIRHAAGALLLGGWPLVSPAACEPDPPPVRDEFWSSAAVVVGPVVGETYAPAAGRREEGVLYTVRIEAALRGKPGKTLTFFKEMNKGRVEVAKGRTHIFFVRQASGHLEVDRCGNSGPLPEKEEVLTSARKLNGR